MEGAIGQQYTINVFGRGVAQDMSHDLPISQVRDTYIQANRMAINQDLINGLRAVNGDTLAHTLYSGTTPFVVLAAHEMSGHLYTFILIAGVSIQIYRDATLIGESANYPGTSSNGYLYIDGNPGSGELAITDNSQVPIILDVDDMYAQTVVGSATTYTTDYDKTLYEVNQDINLTQPVFRRLNDVGVGGGVLSGSYAYAYRLVSDNGDETGWSPPTPFIPVPSNYGDGSESTFLPGAKTYGEAASLNATKYGIDIAFRVVNYSGFDYVEIKRIPNNVGAPVEYTATPQYIRLPTSISETILTVVNFTDINSIDWATLDQSNTIENSIIATSRTVRFNDNRLVLGGVTYESRVFDDTDVFNDLSGTQGEAFKKDIGVAGYTDIQNQVYSKSQRLGERYGYALQITDNTGGRSFALPIPDLINYKFPERREAFSRFSANDDLGAEASTVYSDTADVVTTTYEVYNQGTETKSNSRINNIIDNIDSDADGDNEIYQVLHPVAREDSDDYESAAMACDIVEGTAPGVGTSYAPTAYGHSIMATGMKLGGLDTSKLPSWAKGFSILRTEPAGRVVAQGIGVYALEETATASVDKALNKLWVYSPELDDVIGDKPDVFQDIIANPEDYEIQLVSPVGFFPEFYSGAPDVFGTRGVGIDFVTQAMAYYSSSHINPFDVDATTGRGSGNVTFGRWRNQTTQGSGINQGTTDNYVYGINSARQNTLINDNYGHDMAGRSKYLEVTLDAEIYAETSGPSISGDHLTARNFHEPFYVVNIVKTGANVSNNNIDQFKELGHYIPLASLIGLGTGLLNQAAEITSERIEDFHWSCTATIARPDTHPISSDEYSYIWVAGQRWLNVTHWLDADVTAIRTTLNSADTFTQASDGGDVCEESYGIYEVDIADGVYYIKFPYQTVGTSTNIIPEVDGNIEVRYDTNKPVDILLGDTIIGPASFAPIDVDKKGGISHKQYFDITSAFPFQTFQFRDEVYHSPVDTASGTAADQYSSGGDLPMSHVRQWLVTFMCESSINLPFVYKDFFPYKNYIMRPLVYDDKDESETVDAYLGSLNIYTEYDEDYPDEYLNWNYGGFQFPNGSNFDYQKQHRDIYTELPVGISEILEYPKRLHWGSKRSAATISRGVSTAFPATNIYDILLKDAAEINILYDQYSGKGNNLYAIMDRGVVGLLTDKALLRDGVSDELGVILSDSGFIQGEFIIDPFVGCPDKRWRGRSEGSIKNQQGIHIPGLVFQDHDDIYLLSGNSVASIGTNNRATLVDVIKGITDSTKLTSTFDHARNELWLKIGDQTYIYGFAINNWVGEVSDTDIAIYANSKYYGTSRNVRLGLTNYYTGSESVLAIYSGQSGYAFGSDLAGTNPNSFVKLAVTPAGMSQFVFTDIFINSSIQPARITASVNSDLSDPFTTIDTKNIAGLYRTTLGRTAAARVLIGNTLYVKIEFASEAAVDLGYVRTGYKKVTGS